MSNFDPFDPNFMSFDPFSSHYFGHSFIIFCKNNQETDLFESLCLKGRKQVDVLEWIEMVLNVDRCKEWCR